jgi:hypothetical protein
MNLLNRRLVPAPAVLAVACLGLAGCLAGPDLDAPSDPMVVTEAGEVTYAEPQSPERAAAIAEIRAQAAAGDLMGYPDAFQTAQTTRLAAREEPRPVVDVDAIQAELAAIARRQAAARSPQEIAALKARAAELQRLAAAAQARTARP